MSKWVDKQPMQKRRGGGETTQRRIMKFQNTVAIHPHSESLPKHFLKGKKPHPEDMKNQNSISPVDVNRSQKTRE